METRGIRLLFHNAQIKKRYFSLSFYFVVLVLFIPMLFLASCTEKTTTVVNNTTNQGGGGDEGDGEEIKIDTLSSTSALPASLLTITGSGFDPTAALSVRFFDGKDFTVDIPVIDANTTAVNVSVPPFIDMTTGEFEAGVVNVKVIQTSGTITLRSNTIFGFEIGSLPTLTLPPGEVTANIAGFLELTLTDTQNRLSELDTSSGGQINTETLRSELETMRIQFGQLKNMIRDSIANPGQAETVGEINGIPVTLDQESLRLADQWMVAVIDGILAQLQVAPLSKASLLATAQATGCTQIDEPTLCSAEKTLTGYKTVDGSEQQTSQEYLMAVLPEARDILADLSKKFAAATAVIGAGLATAGGSIPLNVVALLTAAPLEGLVVLFVMDATSLSVKSDDKDAAKRLLDDFDGFMEFVLTGAISPILGAISEPSGILFDLYSGLDPLVRDFLNQVSAFLGLVVTFSSNFTFDAGSEVHRSFVTVQVSGGSANSTVQVSSTWGQNMDIGLDSAGNGSTILRTPDHVGCYSGTVSVFFNGTEIGSFSKECF